MDFSVLHHEWRRKLPCQPARADVGLAGGLVSARDAVGNLLA
jgi:hypothetical protein